MNTRRENQRRRRSTSDDTDTQSSVVTNEESLTACDATCGACRSPLDPNSRPVLWPCCLARVHDACHAAAGDVCPLCDRPLRPSEAVAERRLRRHADAGRAVALFYLGRAREEGWFGGDAAPREAQDWYERAVDAGNADAAFALGKLHFEGVAGVRHSKRRARELWARAVPAGVGGAAVALGRSLLGGDGVARDERGAARLFTAAAHEGLAEAQYQLGRMHLEGLGGLDDADDGEEWLALAAAAGHADALAALAARRPSELAFVFGALADGLADDGEGFNVGRLLSAAEGVGRLTIS